MKRILISSSSYPPNFMGGAELVAHEHAKILVSRGYEVAVFAGDFEGPGERHSMRKDEFEGVPVYRVTTRTEDFDPSCRNYLHPRVDEHFNSVLQYFHPDIVHCHNIIGLSARIPVFAKERGVPVVCTLHDHWGYCLRNTAVRHDGVPCYDMSLCAQCLPRSEEPLRFRKDLIALALDHVDLFLAPSDYLAKRYLAAGIEEDRIHVVPNGIDTRRFSPKANQLPGKRLRLGFVGHFGEHKGVEILLRALLLLDANSEYHLSLIGWGPREAAYREKIAQCGLGDRVTIHGSVAQRDMPAIYAQMDVLILPSVWGENQPVCIMEAMASGVAIIASREGGIPELIDDGRNGFLVPARDPAALARAIERLIKESDLVFAMGAQGRERVARATYESQIEAQLAVYASLAGGAKSPEVRRPIISLAGDFRADLSSGTRRLMQSQRHSRHYLIPDQWLTERQRAQTLSRRKIGPESAWRRRAQHLIERYRRFLSMR